MLHPPDLQARDRHAIEVVEGLEGVEPLPVQLQCLVVLAPRRMDAGECDPGVPDDCNAVSVCLLMELAPVAIEGVAP